MATCKAGQQIIRVLADIYESGKVETYIYIVRSVRNGRVFATKKVQGITWVKKSSKTGDWGWDDSISPYDRTDWEQGGDLPPGYGTTKGSAIRSEIRSIKRFIKRHGGEDCEAAEKALKTLERMNKQHPAKPKAGDRD